MRAGSGLARPWNDPTYGTSGNILLDRLLGAKVHVCKTEETRKDKAKEVMAEIEARGEKGYFIPTGGSNPIGALGYVECALEIIEQAHQQGIKVDHVVLASGSGGIQAGMIVGLAGAKSGISCIGIGIDIDHDPVYVRTGVENIIPATAELLGVSDEAKDAELIIAEGYGAPEYGMPNDKMIEAVELLAQTEAILLDPVYSGKAMAALIAMIANKRFGKEETIVFVHTGGGPALFAYSEIFTSTP